MKLRRKKDEDNNVYNVVEADPKTFTTHDMIGFSPQTANQSIFMQNWQDGYHVVGDGIFGTGKTYIAMYLALNEVLNPDTPAKKLIIIRSAVASREVGFLPGTEEDKLAPFKIPYVSICDEVFKKTNQFKHMEARGVIEFHSSAFVRGNTFKDAVVLIDEAQNFNYTELISCISRLGTNSRLIVLGDAIHQNDLQYKKSDKTGFPDVLEILNRMPSIRRTSFTHSDIVRSEFCKEFAKAITDSQKK